MFLFTKTISVHQFFKRSDTNEFIDNVSWNEIKKSHCRSASPLSRSMESMRRLEDAGASAIVMHSLLKNRSQTKLNRWISTSYMERRVMPKHLHTFPIPAIIILLQKNIWSSLQRQLTNWKFPLSPVSTVLLRALDILCKKDGRSRSRCLELNVYYIPTSGTMSGVDVENRYVEMLKQVNGAVKYLLREIKSIFQFDSECRTTSGE